MSERQYFVYMLECSDGSYYSGYTTDVERRLKEHNGELDTPSRSSSARYTRGRRPVILIRTEVFATRSDALKREAAIKKLTRPEKELLLKSNTQGTSDKRKKSVL